MGQTRLAEPERVLPEVLNRIRRVLDENERGRLLTALASLMNSEEALAMVEQMLDAAEESLLDTPYLRRIRQQGREEGWLAGKEEGLEAGLATGLREAILEAIALRFNPSVQEYRQINQDLENILSRKVLQQLHAAAIQAEEMADFMATLSQELAG